ncbi:hypothetical protein [Streptomyces sp. AP-93]|uniref:hypothetical protein n=1 Tax=Streptomyces sp. AP-93 TaxID=2929048 RepID=UPI001FAF20FC|nr:hypothetical protein [Streptomyces sp. AP-93]MCJ0872121.1 hypothetical protein [Streptomyces sp. AP-93]
MTVPVGGCGYAGGRCGRSRGEDGGHRLVGADPRSVRIGEEPGHVHALIVEAVHGGGHVGPGRGVEHRVADHTNVVSVIGYWYFGRLDSDGSTTWAMSKEAELDTSVQVTVVHDAQDNPLKLYIDGSYVSDMDDYYASANDSTTFAVGKGLAKGANGGFAWGNYLPEKINDVRLWSGAMHNATQALDFT